MVQVGEPMQRPFSFSTWQSSFSLMLQSLSTQTTVLFQVLPFMPTSQLIAIFTTDHKNSLICLLQSLCSPHHECFCTWPLSHLLCAALTLVSVHLHLAIVTPTVCCTDSCLSAPAPGHCHTCCVLHWLLSRCTCTWPLSHLLCAALTLRVRVPGHCHTCCVLHLLSAHMAIATPVVCCTDSQWMFLHLAIVTPAVYCTDSQCTWLLPHLLCVALTLSSPGHCHTCCVLHWLSVHLATATPVVYCIDSQCTWPTPVVYCTDSQCTWPTHVVCCTDSQFTWPTPVVCCTDSQCPCHTNSYHFDPRLKPPACSSH